MDLTALLQFSGRQRLPLVLQAEAGECGLACLAMVAGWHGLRLDLASLRQRFPVSAQGARLRELISSAEALDLAARPLRLEVAELGSLSLPALLHWDMGHFVVLRAVRGGHALLHDPAVGERRLPLAEVSRHFTGVALELRPTPGFSPGEARRRIPLGAFWQQVRSARGTLVQLLGLSLLLQVFALAGPFHMQLVVDEAIAGNAADLLTVLAMGFGLLLLLQVATAALRGWVLMVLGNSLAFGFALRLFRHLLALPLAWFERRHLGDVLARFGSLGPVQGLLTEGLVATVVDGLMAVTTLAMLLLYAPDLALVVLAAVAVYTLVRLAMVPSLRRRTAEQIAAGAREQTVFMESVRAVQAIKVFGREPQRLGLWQQRQAERLNAGMALTRLGLVAGALNGLVFGIEGILVVWFGAAKVLAGGFSVGMLYAFMAWRGQFTGRVAALVDRALELRLLGLHLERLADIALAEPEAGSGAAPLAAVGEDPPPPRLAGALAPIRGELQLVGVGFRWQADGPALFEGLDLHLPAGSCLALVGPSGCGKTTLGKLLLGLHRPHCGALLVDGQPLGAAALPAYRRQVAAVLQDDVLLAGTLADNIAMFDPQRDDQRVLEVARLAGIHATIAALPLQYQTLVGDMGLSLSGGQRQRLLLARALYQQPRVLLLDEGTAHLDPETTAQVLRGLAAQRMTRVLITHDPAVAAMADQVLVLGAAACGDGVAPPQGPASGYHPPHAGHRLHGRDA